LTGLTPNGSVGPVVLQTLYDVTLVLCCLYAFIAGGRTEKLGSLLTLTASIVSVLIWYRPLEWRAVHWNMFAVDLVTFLLATWLAIRSDRFWPMWFAGFCLVGVMTHLAVAAMPNFASMAYSLSQGFWAYPAMLALVIGTWTHRRGMRGYGLSAS